MGASFGAGYGFIAETAVGCGVAYGRFTTRGFCEVDEIMVGSVALAGAGATGALLGDAIGSAVERQSQQQTTTLPDFIVKHHLPGFNM